MIKIELYLEIYNKTFNEKSNILMSNL